MISHFKEKVFGLHRQVYLYLKKKKLKNKDFSLISSNCNGGWILHELGLEFNSPFVNLFITASDYIKLLSDLEIYLNTELIFLEKGKGTKLYPNLNYPVGILKDIYIYFMHYQSEEEAYQAWNRRVKRIRWDNLFIIMTDRSFCTYDDLVAFDELPYKNKVVFTHIPYPEIKSSYYIKGFETEEKVGILSDFRKNSWKRYYDDFNFIKFFNNL